MTGIRFFEELGSELERAARQAPAPGRRGWRVPVGGVAVLSSTLVAVVVAVGAIVLLSHTRTTHPVGTAKPSDAQAFPTTAARHRGGGGDPASDVLTMSRMFLPFHQRLTRQVSGLKVVLRLAARAGYPVRVAVIASKLDLGADPALWRHPQRYAELLGGEISGINRDPILIVMPNGFGLYQPGRTQAASKAELAHTPVPLTTGSLAMLATAEIRILAAASGHPIANSSKLSHRHP
jgi:hypothetical protein